MIMLAKLSCTYLKTYEELLRSSESVLLKVGSTTPSRSASTAGKSNCKQRISLD
jgi:hypothetical protein